jgi:transglutaminase-like putative cysteine protease
MEAFHHPALWTERRIRDGDYVWGDCDDMSMYLAALLTAVGIPSELVVVGHDRAFHHVYVSACGLSLDPTAEAGTRMPPMRRRWRVPV